MLKTPLPHEDSIRCHHVIIHGVRHFLATITLNHFTITLFQSLHLVQPLVALLLLHRQTRAVQVVHESVDDQQTFLVLLGELAVLLFPIALDVAFHVNYAGNVFTGRVTLFQRLE